MAKIPKKPEKPNLPAIPGEQSGRLAKITEPRCKVCMSKFRPDIEVLVARGYSYTSIEKQLEGLGEEITAKSISRHRERHMDIEQGAFRTIMERQAQELMEAESEGIIRIVSGKAWLDMFIQKATDVLIAGEMEIEAKDVVKAIELRSALEKEGIDIFQQQVMQQLQAIIQAMKDIIAPELARQIGERAKEIVEEQRRSDHRRLSAESEVAEFEEIA